MSSRHLESVFANHKIITNSANKLYRLGDSFVSTGNDKAASMLYRIAEDIMASADELRDSHSEELGRQFDQARQGTANILTALVAGVSMGKGSAIKELSEE